MRFAVLLVAIGLGLGAEFVTAQVAPVTVFVVRHAEKGPENPDPELTAAGQARANALAFALADAEVTTIITSEFKRTQLTARPLAQLRHLNPKVLGAAKMDELIGQLTALPAGGRALVVSHSNLVPTIVERLSGQKVGALTDADYDRIYVVTLTPGGPASVLYLHFGAPAAGNGGPMRP